MNAPTPEWGCYTHPTGWGFIRLPHARRLDAEIETELKEIKDMSRGESDYVGRDVNGDPFGVSAPRANHVRDGFPRKCRYCQEIVTGKRDLHTHMVTAHKG